MDDNFNPYFGNNQNNQGNGFSQFGNSNNQFQQNNTNFSNESNSFGTYDNAFGQNNGMNFNQQNNFSSNTFGGNNDFSQPNFGQNNNFNSIPNDNFYPNNNSFEQNNFNQGMNNSFDYTQNNINPDFQQFGNSYIASSEPKKKKKTGLIIVIIIFSILLCCCCIPVGVISIGIKSFTNELRESIGDVGMISVDEDIFDELPKEWSTNNDDTKTYQFIYNLCGLDATVYSNSNGEIIATTIGIDGDEFDDVLEYYIGYTDDEGRTYKEYNGYSGDWVYARDNSSSDYSYIFLTHNDDDDNFYMVMFTLTSKSYEDEMFDFIDYLDIDATLQ